MEMRPLHAHYPPAHSHLGGREGMLLAGRAECPEMPVLTSHSNLTSKCSIKPLLSLISHLATRSPTKAWPGK